MIRTLAVFFLMNILLEISGSTIRRGPSYNLHPVKKFRLIPREVKNDRYEDINKDELEPHHEYKMVPKYEFKYTVSDPISGDYKTHHESKSGNQVKGEYSFVESDGYIRRVIYTADDEHGFVAVVSRKPISSQPNLQGKPQANPITSYISSSKNVIIPDLNIEIIKAREYVPEKMIQENSYDDAIPYVLNIIHSKPMDQIYPADKESMKTQNVDFRTEGFNNNTKPLSSSTKYEVTEETEDTEPENVKQIALQHGIINIDAGKNNMNTNNDNLLETSPLTRSTTGNNENVIVTTKTMENQTRPSKSNVENEEMSNTSSM